jgi:hypothetical protein
MRLTLFRIKPANATISDLQSRVAKAEADLEGQAAPVDPAPAAS